MKWLCNTLMFGPELALVRSEREYAKALKQIGATADGRSWLIDGSNATAHFFKSSNGKACAIVSLDDCTDRDGVVVAGLLVHEAVHVFQQYCDFIGESRPSVEFEAYSIQTIAQKLMSQYAAALPKTRQEEAQ